MAITDDLPKAWRPPMGWNSWDSYGTTVTEREVLANARFIADHLKDAGWDTWSSMRVGSTPTPTRTAIPTAVRCASMGTVARFPDEQRFPSAAGGKGFGRSPMRCTDSA